METKSILYLTLATALMTPACGSGSSGGGGSAQPATCEGTKLVADSDHNFKFSSTLTLPPIKVAGSNKDLTFDWGDVSSDLTRHSFNPKRDVKLLTIIPFELPVKDLQTKMIHDLLESQDMNLPLTYRVRTNVKDGEDAPTSAKLMDFSLQGNPVTWDGASRIDNFFDATKHSASTSTFAFMISSSENTGSGVLLVQTFVLDTSTSNTQVKMSKDSSQLKFTADLTKLKPAGIPAGEGDISLDFDNDKLKDNAMGDPFYPGYMTHALLGRYNETPAELAEKFLDIDRIATELYQMDIEEGSPLKFSDLKDKDGKSFSGISDSGTWLVALQCVSATCHNPAPWYLSVLKPACD